MGVTVGHCHNFYLFLFSTSSSSSFFLRRRKRGEKGTTLLYKTGPRLISFAPLLRYDRIPARLHIHRLNICTVYIRN